MERANILLEKYTQGKLTAKEQQEFDALVIRDENFKKRVIFYTDLKKIAEAKHDNDFLKLLNEFEEEAGQAPLEILPISNQQKKSKRTIRTYWSIAASILVILGITYYLMLAKNLTSQELFIENFEPNRNITHPITMSGDDDKEMTKAFIAYESGNYKEADSRFAALYDKDPKPYYLFYRANALIGLNKSQKAIPILQQYENTKDDMANRSNWYLAMAHLQLGDIQNSIKQLEITIANGTFKVEEAKILLSKLKKIQKA